MLESTEYLQANVHVCCTYWWASASASSPGEHSTCGLHTASSQRCKTAAGTSSTGKIDAAALHWGAVGEEATAASGHGPDKGQGQTRELCCMSSLRWGGFHCSIVERRGMSAGEGIHFLTGEGWQTAAAQARWPLCLQGQQPSGSVERLDAT